MEEVIKLANRIKDENLRKKVIEILKDPKLTSKDFRKYKPEDIKKARTGFIVSSPSGQIYVERDVLNHTIAVTKACIEMAKIIEEVYGLKLNLDVLIAGAILHDIGKLFEWKVGEKGVEHTGVLIDHSILMGAELYKRDFPEEVIHLVVSHFGETGPTPPRTFEALVLHYVDHFLSIFEARYNTSLQEIASQVPILWEIERMKDEKEKD
ncbi:MAG: dihydroneopterin 2',3'-cyclic phosphate phosphodiesterase [Candidatus Aenigmarchaeota archaeon ex4484_224]|nr:MAG: dihydroneopterin 2',3'-cyclic phosphate phosphodiesterase [Candidatus Aenigmarchaeota archaeon ex4484_224]